MHRLSMSVWMILCLPLAWSSRGAASSSCTVSTNATNDLAAKSVLEFPSGAIDGNNHTFALGKIPVTGTDVRLFKDGIELPSGTAFHLEDKSLTLTSAPVPGDVLLVSYCMEGAKPTGTSLLPGGQAASLAEDGLKESVRRDDPRVPAASGTGARGSEAAMETQPRVAGSRTAFLDLLSRRIRRPDSQPLTSRSRSEEPLSGFEGMGDQPFADPYSTLVGGKPGDPMRSLLLPGRGASAGPLPLSLRLLQRRIEDSERNGFDNEARGKE